MQNTYPIPVNGVDGRTVQQYYDSKGGPEAYLGTCLPGFPNFFLLGGMSISQTCIQRLKYFANKGPNTVAGYASFIFTAEVQVRRPVCQLFPLSQS
jgi:hypothetical protein